MARNRRGRFICLEGIDGSGKTTQARLLVGELCQKGFNAVYTTEPSNGQIGRLIRRYVLNRERRVPIALEALLFAADRISHVETEIKPMLEMNRIVVCDRYLYSTLAYQGAAGVDLKWIEEINRFALIPDLALFIDVPPEVAEQRLKGRRSVMETFPNQQRVRQAYLDMVADNRLRRVDGNRPINQVASDVMRIVEAFLRSQA